MRFFAVIVACLLVTRASAWNVHEATDCVSHRMVWALRETYLEMSEWVEQLDQEGQELVQEVRTKLNSLHDDLDAEIDRKLSEVDSDCKRQSSTEKEECLKQGMTLAAIVAFKNAVNKAAGVLRDHTEAFGQDRVQPMKDLVNIMMNDIPHFEDAIHGCFYNIYREN